MENNLLIVLLAILPTFLYSMILYLLLPKNTVSFKVMSKYFTIGLISPLIVILIHYTFPELKLLFGLSIVGTTLLFAFFEELSKYITNYWSTTNITNTKNKTTTSIMMYSLSTAASFAIVENIHYAMTFNKMPIEVTLVRGFSANVMHLICGLIMGYFIAKARFQKDVIFKFFAYQKLIRIKIIKFFIIISGLILTSLYHTLYNLIAIEHNENYRTFFKNELILFLLGIFIIYYMFREPIIKSKNKSIYEKK